MSFRRLTEVIYIKQGQAHSKGYMLTLTIMTAPLESAKLDRKPKLRIFERLTRKKAAESTPFRKPLNVSFSEPLSPGNLMPPVRKLGRRTSKRIPSH